MARMPPDHISIGGWGDSGSSSSSSDSDDAGNSSSGSTLDHAHAHDHGQHVQHAADARLLADRSEAVLHGHPHTQHLHQHNHDHDHDHSREPHEHGGHGSHGLHVHWEHGGEQQGARRRAVETQAALQRLLERSGGGLGKAGRGQAGAASGLPLAAQLLAQAAQERAERGQGQVQGGSGGGSSAGGVSAVLAHRRPRNERMANFLGFQVGVSGQGILLGALCSFALLEQAHAAPSAPLGGCINHALPAMRTPTTKPPHISTQRHTHTSVQGPPPGSNATNKPGPGVFLYLLPMGTGQSKGDNSHHWGFPEHSFWCCYGERAALRGLCRIGMVFGCDGTVLIRHCACFAKLWVQQGGVIDLCGCPGRCSCSSSSCSLPALLLAAHAPMLRTGTAVESFSKLQDSIYFKDEGGPGPGSGSGQGQGQAEEGRQKGSKGSGSKKETRSRDISSSGQGTSEARTWFWEQGAWPTTTAGLSSAGHGKHKHDSDPSTEPAPGPAISPTPPMPPSTGVPRLYVNQYVSSTVTWAERGVVLAMDATLYAPGGCEDDDAVAGRWNMLDRVQVPVLCGHVHLAPPCRSPFCSGPWAHLERPSPSSLIAPPPMFLHPCAGPSAATKLRLTRHVSFSYHSRLGTAHVPAPMRRPLGSRRAAAHRRAPCGPALRPHAAPARLGGGGRPHRGHGG